MSVPVKYVPLARFGKWEAPLLSDSFIHFIKVRQISSHFHRLDTHQSFPQFLLPYTYALPDPMWYDVLLLSSSTAPLEDLQSNHRCLH